MKIQRKDDVHLTKYNVTYKLLIISPTKNKIVTISKF